MRDFCPCAGRVSRLIVLTVTIVGCGGKSSNPVCTLTAINVFPKTATVDHTAVAPGNTQHFDAFAATSSPGCVVSQNNLTTATWSVSDATTISINNVQGASYGTATCKGATTGPAIVMATVPAGDGTNVTNTASLTCN
jgi:hypothetical protein